MHWLACPVVWTGHCLGEWWVADRWQQPGECQSGTISQPSSGLPCRQVQSILVNSKLPICWNPWCGWTSWLQTFIVRNLDLQFYVQGYATHYTPIWCRLTTLWTHYSVSVTWSPWADNVPCVLSCECMSLPVPNFNFHNNDAIKFTWPQLFHHNQPANTILYRKICLNTKLLNLYLPVLIYLYSTYVYQWYSK